MTTLLIDSDRFAPVVRLRGELDWASSEGLESALLGQLDAHGAVVLDREALSFLDCAGLGVVLAINRYARRTGRRVVLAGPSPAVVRLLALTECHLVLDTRSSLAEALDAVGRGTIVALERERWPA